ncbi:hypothetical protein H9L13_06850 [Sphingomonas lutea]|uniref:Apea-like HEPN domain-containing protein n=1 Tax=Sphingomonas lutea TaxID=1045317 RepID=A0A7G9SF25_9SPHN|nr:hypothetical protein [Sphingomonas lutea]QNN66450.1 hypothetical protein H9L13_06850 [Sphingomonas lutea]
MAEPDDDLLHVRQNIFAAVLLRLAYLRGFEPPPERNFIGQRYIEDPAKVRCVIGALFMFPGEVEPFEYYERGVHVTVQQHGPILHVEIDRFISQLLWDDLRLLGEGQEFVVGYLSTLMPSLNRRLLDNRYMRGHLLSRTFAVFEAVDLHITVGSRRLWIHWPPSLPPFPPTVALSGLNLPTYVRDYIDSIAAYFRHEYDDCVRRVITATENFMDAHRWRAKPLSLLHNVLGMFSVRQKMGSSFRGRLRNNLDLTKISGTVLHENLLLVYSLRNRIVHNGYRMASNSAEFCDKAVISLYYLLSRHCTDDRVVEYLFTLHQQYFLHKNLLGQLLDLDRIARWNLAERPDGEILDVDDPEAMDEFFFGSIRFTDADRRSV